MKWISRGVTAPIARVIADINIVGIGINGVNIEVVVLEQEKDEEIPYLDLSAQINN